MILSKTVFVKLNGNNIKHYKDKGYDLSPFYHVGKGGYDCFHVGFLEVKVEDLLPKSRVEILTACDICGKERWVMHCNREDICRDCAVKREEYRKNMSLIKTGKKHSEESIEKMREYYYTVRYPGKEPVVDEAKKERNKIRNRNRYDYEKWKRDIFKKYNNTCQKCGEKDTIMNTQGETE